MLLFFKAKVPGAGGSDLFAMPVHVDGYTTKHGTYVAPHTAARHKRFVVRASAEGRALGDLFAPAPAVAPTVDPVQAQQPPASPLPAPGLPLDESPVAKLHTETTEPPAQADDFHEAAKLAGARNKGPFTGADVARHWTGRNAAHATDMLHAQPDDFAVMPDGHSFQHMADYLRTATPTAAVRAMREMREAIANKTAPAHLHERMLSQAQKLVEAAMKREPASA